MATLSASRRNSTTSGSLPNSPRPSISAGSGFSFSPSPGRMSSLNEEADNVDRISGVVDNNCGANMATVERHGKVLSSERSDSGFSECSSCSNGSRIQNLQTHIFDKVPVIREEFENNSNNNLSCVVVPDVLKMKLEEIVKHRDSEKNMTNANLLLTPNADTKRHTDVSELYENFTIDVSRDPIRKYSTCLDVKMKDPLMKSDFTNTVRMRKKSLENNILKDKLSPRKPIFEASGKVSKMKSKFSKTDESLGKPAFVSKPNSNKETNNESMDWKAYKTKNVFERLTACDKSKSHLFLSIFFHQLVT